ncbi:CNH domain-containing protein [Mycena rebaudengoi]|nr:CNH domain-containing protein [Mycena rebaudengoi]
MDRPKLFDIPSLASLKSLKSVSRKSSLADPSDIELHTRNFVSPSLQILPTEIFERIIDFLHSDKAALISCSTVCRSWFPTSRYHLHTLLAVVPDVLSEACRKVKTAVSLKGGTSIFGTNGGVYLSRNSGLFRVLKLPAVSQISALEDQDLLLILSGRRLLAGPLHLVLSRNSAVLYHRLVLISSDASFFQVGEHMGKRVLCISNSGRFSSHFKILEVTESDTTFTFTLFRSFYLPDKATSVHIWNKTIGVGLKSGFQCVDPLSLVTFPVPVNAVPNHEPSPRRCRAMFRLDERFLLCYDRCAFFMNKAGASFEGEFAIRWQDQSTHFALHAPYLITFTASSMRV